MPTCFRLTRDAEHRTAGSLYCRTCVAPPEPWVPAVDPALLEEVPAPGGDVACANCDGWLDPAPAARTTEWLLARISYLQGIQKRTPHTAKAWGDASDELQPLFAEMAARREVQAPPSARTQGVRYSVPDILLSDVFSEAAHHATVALHARGKALDEAVGRIGLLMSEARDLGIYHRDDNVETVELILAQPKVTSVDVRELQTKLNVLARCAEWFEVARGLRDPS